MHTLTLQLPDEIFEPLMRQAQQTGNTPEEVVMGWVVKAVLSSSEDPLLKLLGTFDADVSELVEKYRMDKLERYRTLLQGILEDHASVPYSYVDFQSEVVLDKERDRYLLVNVGWDSGRRAHWVLAHVDIINGKLWIQTDRTEDGIATELLAAGVPKEDIVLAFMSEERRRHSEFAVA